MFSSILRQSLRAKARPTFALNPAATLTQRYLSQETRAQIQSTVKSSPVVLFMKGNPQYPQCGFSRATVQVLDLQGVPPEKLKTYDILEDPELRSGMKEFSEWPTFPQLYVNGEFVGGCDIVLGMHQSGELETFLQERDVVPKPSTPES